MIFAATTNLITKMLLANPRKLKLIACCYLRFNTFAEKCDVIRIRIITNITAWNTESLRNDYRKIVVCYLPARYLWLHNIVLEELVSYLENNRYKRDKVTYILTNSMYNVRPLSF